MGKDQKRALNLRLLFLICVACVLFLSGTALHAQERVVRVGVYQNAPQVFIDDQGVAKGIYVDLLKEVATREGWTLEFVPGTFASGLEDVQTGDLDILTSIAATDARREFIDFSNETIVSVWAQLYVQPGFEPTNIFDMDNKKVAVMKSGILGERYTKLCDDFNIACKIVPKASYEDALQAVHNRTVDGAVVNSILGFSKEAEFNVARSSIVFSPFPLTVAVPKGQNQDLVVAIDGYMSVWRRDKSSVYYQTLDRWLGVKPQETETIPTWVVWALIVVGVLGVLTVGWNTALQKEVKRRRATEAELSLRTEELRGNETRLNMLLDLSKAAPHLDEKEILKRSLDIAVEVTGSEVGYLHLVNDDQQSLTLSTWNDAALKYCTAAFDSHYPVSEAGIWADSIRTKSPVVHNKYQHEPKKKGYPEGHFHIERHMSTPVTDGNRVSLVIGVGNKDTDYNAFDVIQLQAVANDIEKMVMRRRAEEELKESKKDAEIANEAKSRFLAAMSHDLRTPLNAILGFSDMMRQKAFGELGNAHYDEYADDIYNSGTLLVSLINDVLDLSKIEAGKYELVEENLSVDAFVKTSVHQLESMAERAGLVLELDIPADMPNLKGDERALIQVLNNLLSNAIKFTPKGGTVRVSATVRTDAGITISVSDSGIGMSPEGVIKALSPFEQADGTHSRRHEGTGLGLHLCMNFMKLFGGELDIQSVEHEGTTVTLLFPAKRTVTQV